MGDVVNALRLHAESEGTVMCVRRTGGPGGPVASNGKCYGNLYQKKNLTYNYNCVQLQLRVLVTTACMYIGKNLTYNYNCVQLQLRVLVTTAWYKRS